MKIIKTVKYKKAQMNDKILQQQNGKKELALKLLEWHGGQWSPLYSVGSTWLAGKDVPSEIIYEAIEELEDIVQKKVNYPDTISEDNIIEVKKLQNELKKETIDYNTCDYCGEVKHADEMANNNTCRDCQELGDEENRAGQHFMDSGENLNYPEFGDRKEY